MNTQKLILILLFLMSFDVQAQGLTANCAKAISQTVILIEKESKHWTTSKASFREFTCLEKSDFLEIKFKGIYYDYNWGFSKKTFVRIFQQPDFKKHGRKIEAQSAH